MKRPGWPIFKKDLNLKTEIVRFLVEGDDEQNKPKW